MYSIYIYGVCMWYIIYIPPYIYYNTIMVGHGLSHGRSNKLEKPVGTGLLGVGILQKKTVVARE